MLIHLVGLLLGLIQNLIYCFIMKRPNMKEKQYVSPAIVESAICIEGVICTSGGTERLDEVEGSWGDPLNV